MSRKESILADLQSKVPRINQVYFYDTKGSELYEKITETEEYYLTSKESELLDCHAASIARFCDDPKEKLKSLEERRIVVELGAGSGKKTAQILAAMLSFSSKITYIPVDVSPSALEANRSFIESSACVESIDVQPLIGKFEEKLPETRNFLDRKSFLYLGSSLGNFTDDECVTLMKLVASCLAPRDRFLVGVDTPHSANKPSDRIELAYNDRAGITAAFTLNALSHVNRVAGL
eukprot:g1170.t1